MFDKADAAAIYKYFVAFSAIHYFRVAGNNRYAAVLCRRLHGLHYFSEIF